MTLKAMPSSFPISMSQAKAEFNKGNNLRAYLGCAPGVPTSGTIKLSDLLGKSLWGYYMAKPHAYFFYDLGYYYDCAQSDLDNFWNTNHNDSEIPQGTHLQIDGMPSDNFGITTDYHLTYREWSFVNCGDTAAFMNSFSEQWWGVGDPSSWKWYDSGLGRSWASQSYHYSNAVGANGIYMLAKKEFVESAEGWISRWASQQYYAGIKMK